MGDRSGDSGLRGVFCAGSRVGGGMTTSIKIKQKLASKIPKQTKIWTTRDGQEIMVCDMDNGHLLNTIRLLAKNVRWMNRSIFENNSEPSVTDIVAVYGTKAQALILELARRQLTPSLPD